MSIVLAAFGGAFFGFLGGMAGSKKPAAADKMRTAATAALCSAIGCALLALLVPEILDALRD